MTILETRVKGVNRANAYANELYPRLVEVFRLFVGQKILKADGTLLAKVKKEVDALDLPCTPSLHVYRNSSNYTLSYVVKTCESHPTGKGYDHAYYYEIGVYVGELQGDHLLKLSEREDLKTDYNAAEVQTARDMYHEAKKAADAAQSALHPFGEIDR